MSKYTPGPWKAFIRGRTIAILTRETQAVIAWPGFDSSSYNLKTQKANARLIAAAPDLADALKEAVNCYGKLGGPWNVPSDPGGWLERARAALRKAGEI